MPRKLLLLIGLDASVLVLAWLAILVEVPVWVLGAAIVLIAVLSLMEVRMLANRNRDGG